MDNWNKLSFLPQEELKEIQNKKLRQFISSQILFSPHYRKLFNQHGIKPRHIKTVADLRLIPFTQKEDFLPTKDNPQKFRDFILQPDESLIKKSWPKTKLLKLALIKVIKGQNI